MGDVKIGDQNTEEMFNESNQLESLECPLPISRSDDILILLEKMKQKFPLKFALRGVLYHFTNAKVVCNILSGLSDLTCSDYRHMNDSAEWMIGVDYVKNYIEKKFGFELAEQFEMARGLSPRREK